jgi:hypothetical protein
VFDSKKEVEDGIAPRHEGHKVKNEVFLFLLRVLCVFVVEYGWFEERFYKMLQT